MLLLPFVENSFKHGVSASLDKAWVRIALSVDDTRLKFVVENSVPSGSSAQSAQITSGIGLANVRRRLEILYPNSYTFSTSLKEGIYAAELIIIRS